MSKINCKSYLDSILNEENYKIHFFNGIDDIQSELQTIKIQRAFGDTNTRERELNALVKVSKEIKSNNLLVITWDYEKIEEWRNKKIQFLPLWKWLLEL